MHTYDVLSVVSQRSIDRFFNSLLRCEMDNAFRAVAVQGLDDEWSVEDRTEEERGIGAQPVSASAREVVEHRHQVAITLQRADDMRSDIASPAGDQHSHCMLPFCSNAATPSPSR